MAKNSVGLVWGRGRGAEGKEGEKPKVLSPLLQSKGKSGKEAFLVCLFVLANRGRGGKVRKRLARGNAAAAEEEEEEGKSFIFPSSRRTGKTRLASQFARDEEVEGWKRFLKRENSGRYWRQTILPESVAD